MIGRWHLLLKWSLFRGQVSCRECTNLGVDNTPKTKLNSRNWNCVQYIILCTHGGCLILKNNQHEYLSPLPVQERASCLITKKGGLTLPWCWASLRFMLWSTEHTHTHKKKRKGTRFAHFVTLVAVQFIFAILPVCWEDQYSWLSRVSLIVYGLANPSANHLLDGVTSSQWRQYSPFVFFVSIKSPHTLWENSFSRLLMNDRHWPCTINSWTYISCSANRRCAFFPA